MAKRKPKDDDGAAPSAYAMLLARKIGAEHEFFLDSIGVKNIAIIIQEAFEHYGVAQRLAQRISVGGKRIHEWADPYAGLNPAERKFVEEMDVWTLENVIVRVMTEIDRRRRKNSGGMAGMYKSHAERARTP